MDPGPAAVPRPRTQYRKGIRRRQQIVTAASAVFAEFGYSGGSIRTIAERVGVSPAALLQHFGSKEGLLTAVLEDWAEQQLPKSRAANPRGLDFILGMREVMRYHVTHRGLIELFLTMATEASSPVHPARSFIQNRYATTLDEVCHHLQLAIDAEEIQPMPPQQIEREARTMFAVMDGIELQWLIDPSVDFVGIFDDYLDQAIVRWQGSPRRPDIAE